MVEELDFIDTSALAKRYHAEAGTPWMDKLLTRKGARRIISELTLVEIQSVFAIKIRTGAALPDDYASMRKAFRADMARQRLHVEPLGEPDCRRAVRLIAKYGMTQNIRTLDALQLSIAIRLHAGYGLDHFICSDKSLCALALAEGLSIIDPEMQTLADH